MASKKGNKRKKVVNGIAKSQVEKDSFPVLGYTIWWTLPEADFELLKFADLVKNAFGDTSMVPAAPSKKRAIRAALETIELQGLIRRIRDDQQVLAYALVKEIPDGIALDIELEKLNIIVLDKVADKLEFRGKYKNAEITKAITAAMAVYTTNDLRTIVTTYIRNKGGITMRETGGIYFLRQAEDVNRLAVVIEAAGGTFYHLPVPDISSAKTQITQLVREDLKTQLELAAEEVKNLVNSESARVSSFESKIAAFSDLKDKTALYADMLKTDAEDLTAQIEKLRTEVTEAMMGTMTEFPQSKVFPYKSAVTYKGSAREKYGDTGLVVGYFVDTWNGLNAQYVKVLFDKTNKIVNVAPSQLTVA